MFYDPYSNILLRDRMQKWCASAVTGAALVSLTAFGIVGFYTCLRAVFAHFGG